MVKKDKSLSITQSNHMIVASYKMTMTEKKLLQMAKSKVNPNLPANGMLEFSFTIKEWVETFPTEKDNAYSNIKKALVRLLGRYVYFKERDDEHWLSWLDGAHYYDDEARFRIRLSHSISGYLRDNLTEFTSYNLENVKDVKSFNAMRVYELCSQFKKTGYRRITLDDFRLALAFDGKYKDFKSLNRAVIKESIKEINEKTDLDVSCKYIKIGTAVVALEFFIKEKGGQ